MVRLRRRWTSSRDTMSIAKALSSAYLPIAAVMHAGDMYEA